jgi:hypothetical protein
VLVHQVRRLADLDPGPMARRHQGVCLPEIRGALRQAAIRGALHDGRFWLLTLVFVANAAARPALSVHLVAYLIEAGHPATFAGLLGVLSVTGRLANTAGSAAPDPQRRSRASPPRR